MYGIYDKQEQALVERNLPQETTYAIIDELMFDYPEDDGRFCIVKQVGSGFLCIGTMQLVPVNNLELTQ